MTLIDCYQGKECKCRREVPTDAPTEPAGITIDQIGRVTVGDGVCHEHDQPRGKYDECGYRDALYDAMLVVLSGGSCRPDTRTGGAAKRSEE